LSQPRRTGLVVAHLGKGLAVEDSDGQVLACHTLRQLATVAVGDRVYWEACGDGQGRVVEILPRSSLLVRPAHGGKTRPVAANLQQVLVVLAPEPEPDFLLADQILAVCEHRGIAAALIFNKTDLYDGRETVEACLREYAAIGYPVYRLSAQRGQGMQALQAALQGKTSMLTGQSGVGKSSITRTLLPEQTIRVGDISSHSGLGRHTTTTATLYHLAAGGGDLIDSPGVAIFGMAEMNPAILAQSYREFLSHIARCRYNDCAHRGDQGCALIAAVQQGEVSAARYQRYLKLLEKLPNLRPGM
jgi:ribosome biogenesis GTPase